MSITKIRLYFTWDQWRKNAIIFQALRNLKAKTQLQYFEEKLIFLIFFLNESLVLRKWICLFYD